LAPFGREVASKLENGGLGGVVGGADESLDFRLAFISFNLGLIRGELTRLATVPLILAIITTLPPFPNLIICFATA